MHIGLIAPPWAPVPPVRYGGTEQVVHDLALGLTRLGHDVRLFSVGGSTCPVPRGWYYPTAVDEMGTTLPEATHVLAAYDDLRTVDVIHDHTFLGPLVAAGLPDLPPVVATNHGPFTADTRLIYRAVARNAAVVAISQSQRDSAPDVPVTAVIRHGIDLQAYGYGDGDGGYLAFVGRMSPDKGVDTAVRVARRAGRRLVVVTKMREPGEHAYFEQHVRPLLDDDIELMHELSAPDRIEVMRSAAALLNPLCWREPFGLVMAEALACGTPVLAFPNGAAPEIVDDGRTGYLCGDENNMVAAVARVPSLDRHNCRAAAEQRFDRARMAADHERLYQGLVAN